MKRLVSNSPGNPHYLFMLGQLYLRKNEYRMARELLEIVAKSNEEGVRENAVQLVKQIRAIEDSKSRIEEAKRTGKKVVESEPVLVYGSGDTKTSEAPTDPSSYLREVLRTPGAGETQLQATLVKIECEMKGIVFVVQTANGLLRLRTDKFEDIEITTYDPKVAGDITCSDRKLDNLVVVCYLPNTDKKVKADGVLKSIEYVPADFKLK
jgi:hypothetical protein